MALGILQSFTRKVQIELTFIKLRNVLFNIKMLINLLIYLQ